MMRNAGLALALILAAAHTVAALEFSNLDCQPNNGDKHDAPYTVILSVGGATPGQKVALFGTTDGARMESIAGGNVVCAEWDNKLEAISAVDHLVLPTVDEIAKEDGTVKFRFPSSSCLDNTDEQFIALASNDSTSDAQCDASSAASFGKFIGAGVILEIPKFEGDVEALTHAIREVAFHDLMDTFDEHHSARLEDLSVTVTENWTPLRQYKLEGKTPAAHSGTQGSVYATIVLPAPTYEAAIQSVRHARKEFGHDGTTKGLGRRSNLTPTKTGIEKMIEKRMKAAGSNPSMGVVKLVDSGVHREAVVCMPVENSPPGRVHCSNDCTHCIVGVTANITPNDVQGLAVIQIPDDFSANPAFMNPNSQLFSDMLADTDYENTNAAAWFKGPGPKYGVLYQRGGTIPVSNDAKAFCRALGFQHSFSTEYSAGWTFAGLEDGSGTNTESNPNSSGGDSDYLGGHDYMDYLDYDAAKIEFPWLMNGGGQGTRYGWGAGSPSDKNKIAYVADLNKINCDGTETGLYACSQSSYEELFSYEYGVFGLRCGTGPVNGYKSVPVEGLTAQYQKFWEARDGIDGDLGGK